ncbi:MAG TPA: hypothetical protein VMC02_06785 [Steroidobacteraceae bacterium]|nr:hypothetical protein [Steroidobacteraceae bacterium]
MGRTFSSIGCLMALCAVALSACAEKAAPPASGPTASSASAPQSTPANAYAALASWPDWSGVWDVTFVPPKPGAAPPQQPMFTPAYQKQWDQYQALNKKQKGLNFVSAVASCIPPGVPQSMTEPYPIEFLFTPGRVTILIETYGLTRRIYVDGSPLPENPDPSFQGTSVGHWEGDTLVVETTGILPETSPVNGINGHGAQLHVTERIHLVDPDTLEIATTRTDPTVFLQPYTTIAHYKRHRDWKIMEYVCEQNNHDALDSKGNAAFSLKHNPGE